jgi:hypothetical protein
VSCPGDFVSGAPPPTARLTLDLADWLGLSRVDYCFHYHRDSSLVGPTGLEPRIRIVGNSDEQETLVDIFLARLKQRLYGSCCR